MPNKRRQRGKARGKHSRRDVSSEDMDSQDQLNSITDRLARKRLVKSSTDTEVEQQDQKENVKRQHGGDGYDADFETSEFDTTSAGSDMDCQTQPNRPDNPRAILSPTTQTRNRRNASNAQGNLQRKAVLRQSRKASAQDVNDSSLTSQQQEQHHPKTQQGRKHNKHSKRKNCSTDSVGQPPIPADAESMLKSPENMMMFTLPNGSDSSTPLSNIADSKSEADSCFGFEGLLSPAKELPFSPVLPESPMLQPPAIDSRAASPSPTRHREQGSPPSSPSPSLDLVLRLSPSPERAPPSSFSSSLQSSMETMSQLSYGGSKRSKSQMSSSHGGHKRRLDVNLTGLVPKDEEQGPPKKAVKKKKTQKKKEEDNWTMKMSAEFDDIEMFELTVE